MKILVCGDSWTEGYGVLQSWTDFLDHNVENHAGCGAGNFLIKEQFDRFYNNDFDLVIIGWSGSTRHHEFEFCIQSDDMVGPTIEYFKDKSLDNLLETWEELIDTVTESANCPIIHFSVFGDMPRKKYPNFIDKSYLEFLANKGGTYFKYDIPIFENDWLNDRIYKLTGPFAKKYFPKTWKRACVEREAVRGTGYFLDCGHPDQNGHKLWAKRMEEEIESIFK